MSMRNDFKTIRLEQKGDFVWLIINRPDKFNALNSDVLQEMKEALIEVNSDKKYGLRGMVLTGEGDKAFIAGADIAQMSEMESKDGYKMGKLGQEVTVLLEKLRIPVIAAVNGFALGGGCEMAMSCDFILATESAQFGQPEVKLGLIPGFGGTQRLAKFVGRARAKELIYSGRHINSQTAKQLGLVLEVYASASEMYAAVEAFLQSFLQASPLAIAASKRSINEGVDLEIGRGLAIELEQFSKIFESEDRKIGTQAFVSKEKPQFRGQ